MNGIQHEKRFLLGSLATEHTSTLCLANLKGVEQAAGAASAGLCADEIVYDNEVYSQLSFHREKVSPIKDWEK